MVSGWMSAIPGGGGNPVCVCWGGVGGWRGAEAMVEVEPLVDHPCFTQPPTGLHPLKGT